MGYQSINLARNDQTELQVNGRIIRPRSNKPLQINDVNAVM